VNARCEGHDGLNLPHDLLVALLLDSPDEHKKKMQSSHDTCGTGYLPIG